MSHTFHFTFAIPHPVAAIQPFLTDMDLFAAVHPLIRRMEPLGGDGYRVHEVARLLFIPVAFTYRATVQHSPADADIRLKATILRGTNMDMCFRLMPQDAATLVEETVAFRSPLPVAGVMKRMLGRQHRQLFANIAARLAQQAGSP